MEKTILSLLPIIVMITGIFLSGCTNTPQQETPNNQHQEAVEIIIDSLESPIRNYFITPKILWTFDDYSIQYKYYPPHKGYGGLTEKINSYDGFVEIMVIFTSETYTKKFHNEIRNYSVVNDFGYSNNDIKASLEFFSRPNVEVGSHGWNHSEDLNNVNLSFAYKIINYTLWNWKNNYNITPHFYLSRSSRGNYNVTFALKQFSDNYWTVYGENFRWYNKTLFPNATRDSPAVEYIDKAPYVVEFDPLFGCNWGTPCKNLNEAQMLFNTSSAGKEILFIRGHPSFLNDSTSQAVENLTLWENWIDWIYQTHKLININHTEAIQYNIDRYNFKVMRNNQNNYTIDLTQCQFNHNILFTNPDTTQKRWTVLDENNMNIGEVQDDTFIELASGLKYYFVSN